MLVSISKIIEVIFLLNRGENWVSIILFVFIKFVCIIVEIGVGVIIDLINYFWNGYWVVGMIIVNIINRLIFVFFYFFSWVKFLFVSINDNCYWFVIWNS